MKSLRDFIKYSAWFFALLLTFSSCKDDIPEETEDEFKIETEIEVDGEGILKTKAENSMGWTTGDGIYHKNDQAPVAAYAKSGYELVRFYAKDGDIRYQGGSSYKVIVEKSQIFKAEFRTAATYCINCSITNPDGGTVSGIGCGKSNGTYTLTATPKAGWSSSWTTKQVTVNGANVNEAVTFTEDVMYTVTTRVQGGGTCTPTRQYKKGEYASVAASPTGNAVFVGWYKGGTQVTTSVGYHFTVTEDVTLTARFNGR